MVEFNGVSKIYNKDFAALKNIDLTIEKGEFVFVVGASGAGKSTFLKLIMREEVPTTGTVSINGYDLNTIKKRDIPYFRRTLGVVFQDFRLIPDMRVYDNVAFALRVTGTKEREVRKRVSHALGMVGLLSKTQSLPKELSGGEQQRVAIARALVNDAELIIADEPTGNVDPQMSLEIMELLNHINKSQGTTVIMVTHAHELVRKYDHRIVVLREGELIADGYDKESILPTATEDGAAAPAGYYNPPNEFEDVEKFIFNYGKTEEEIRADAAAAAFGKAGETAAEIKVSSVKSSENADESVSDENAEAVLASDNDSHSDSIPDSGSSDSTENPQNADNSSSAGDTSDSKADADTKEDGGAQ